MRILLVSNYYYPEHVGAAIWVRQMAHQLRDRGHTVTVVTSFPSYPQGRIFEAYRGKLHLRETIEGIDVIRTFTYATESRRFFSRICSFGAFCISSIIGGLREIPKADLVYAVLPPLPLGVSAWILAKAARARLIVNVQDIYPDIAIATGYLRNRLAIGFFRAMERWIYSRAERVVVISRGFQQNLEAKGVPRDKIAVIPNWADPNEIVPMDRDNAFRREIGVNGEFLVLYSGGITVNSDLGSVLDAAMRLPVEQFRFVFVGEGIGKAALVQRAADQQLTNVIFLPFQPLERYAEVLSAADATLVTLSSAASFASVPSKIYKQMAASRPILAVSNPGTELDRLIETSGCGVFVPLGDPDALVAALNRGVQNRAEFERMGRSGRSYLERECSLEVCLNRLEQIFMESTTLRRLPGRS